jgi:lipopolysaccharide export system permease protein
VVGFKLVHRTIFYELFRVFLLALTALTALLLLAGLVAEATQHGLGPAQILGAIPLLLPNMLPYTLPTTTLFATCIVYGRLAADNEILAIKAAGVHIVHVVWPAVLLGLGSSAVTAGLYYDVIPSTHYVLRYQVFANMQDYLYGTLRRDGRIAHPKINYTIDVHHVEGDVLRDAIFRRYDPKIKAPDIIARASEAKLRVDVEKKLLWLYMHDCYIVDAEGKDNGHVDDKAWPVDLPGDLDSAEKFRASDMTWLELFEYRQRLRDDLAKHELDVAVLKSKWHNLKPPPHVPQQVEIWAYSIKLKKGQIAAINTEIQVRPAIAMGCLFFVMIGCPIGIWFSKSDYLSAFITCFLPIIVVYYPLLLSGINLAKSRQLAPMIAVWAANAVMLVVALPLFRRLARN